MCGIAGIYISERIQSLQILIKAMADTLVHRGPDGEGYYMNEKGNLALGHRRLSIIDLSENGSQPMHYAERYVITYNGQIYNYIELKQNLLAKGYNFKSTSDTEVLLALYADKKEKCLDDLDGMFAFAIYDKVEQTLFCARDRFGEKPFYYHHHQGKQFVFASEMKAIFKAGVQKKLNNTMLYNFLAWNYVSNPLDREETFYDGIVKLPPTSYLIVDKNLTIKKFKYWDLDYKNQNSGISTPEAIETIKSLFNESVSLRLRSDVTVGSCLSGGLDSSAIVSTIKKLYPENKLKVFSAKFKNFEKDESQYIDQVVSHTHTEPYAVNPGFNSFLQNLDKILYHQEEPFLSASITAQFEVMNCAQQNQVKVLLDGQGSDEIFGGYDYLMRAYFQELYIKDKTKFESEWDEFTQRGGITVERDIKFKLQTLLQDNYKQLEKFKGFQSPSNRNDFNSNFYSEYKSYSYQHSIRSKPNLNYMLYESTTGDAMEQILRYADRNAMANSVEIRLPFLSHKLAEFVFTLPYNIKIQEGWSKYILRKSIENILPKEIVWRKEKVGFEAPQSEWLENTQAKELITEAKQELVKHNILDKKVLENTSNCNWNYLVSGKLLSNFH